jgi:hypothetical protein
MEVGPMYIRPVSSSLKISALVTVIFIAKMILAHIFLFVWLQQCFCLADNPFSNMSSSQFACNFLYSTVEI